MPNHRDWPRVIDIWLYLLPGCLPYTSRHVICLAIVRIILYRPVPSVPAVNLFKSLISDVERTTNQSQWTIEHNVATRTHVADWRPTPRDRPRHVKWYKSWPLYVEVSFYTSCLSSFTCRILFCKSNVLRLQKNRSIFTCRTKLNIFNFDDESTIYRLQFTCHPLVYRQCVDSV